MKISKLIPFSIVLYANIVLVNAQQTTCENAEQYIPIYQQQVDFNKDKLIDSVVFLEKKEKKDGDSTLVIFYKRNINGQLEHFKTFGNLFPLFFNSYNINYELKNKQLEDTFQSYVGLKPDTKIEIKKTIIAIIKKPTAITYYYEFVFDPKKNNWFLYTRKNSSTTFTSPTERYFFDNPKAIPLEKYHFLLDIKE